MDLLPFVGPAIRYHREIAQLSQEELADKASIDRTYVSGVERGIKNPSIKVLQRLSHALGVDLDELLTTAKKLADPPED